MASPEDAGLRRRVWGWMMFDWASQPYLTLLLTFIFAPYFGSAVIGDATRAQTYWGYALTVSGVLIAALAPILGSIADSSGRRMPWIIVFSALYLVGSFGLWWAVPSSEHVVLILASFAIGLIGMEFAIIFTNAMLPDLGPREEIGRISGSGWALGYWGGVLALVIVLLFLAENDQGVTFLGTAPLFGLDPGLREGTRAVGPFTTFWYALFMIPFFLWVKEAPKGRAAPGRVARGLGELWRTIRRLPRQPSLFAYLGASMFYRDALNGIFIFGGIYALGMLGWTVVDIGVFGIIGAISGAVFAWVGGHADKRYGPKPVILAGIIGLLAVCLIVITLTRTTVLGLEVAETSSLPDIAFKICGAIIGACGGALQAASRTMMVRQANPARMTEAFGLYALAGKATSFLAPALIAMTTDLSGSQRLGITPLIVLFSIGLLLLGWVDPEGEGAGPQEDR